MPRVGGDVVAPRRIPGPREVDPARPAASLEVRQDEGRPRELRAGGQPRLPRQLVAPRRQRAPGRLVAVDRDRRLPAGCSPQVVRRPDSRACWTAGSTQRHERADDRQHGEDLHEAEAAAAAFADAAAHGQMRLHRWPAREPHGRASTTSIAGEGPHDVPDRGRSRPAAARRAVGTRTSPPGTRHDYALGKRRRNTLFSTAPAAGTHCPCAVQPAACGPRRVQSGKPAADAAASRCPGSVQSLPQQRVKINPPVARAAAAQLPAICSIGRGLYG